MFNFGGSNTLREEHGAIAAFALSPDSIKRHQIHLPSSEEEKTAKQTEFLINLITSTLKLILNDTELLSLIDTNPIVFYKAAERSLEDMEELLQKFKELISANELYNSRKSIEIQKYRYAHSEHTYIADEAEKTQSKFHEKMTKTRNEYEEWVNKVAAFKANLEEAKDIHTNFYSRLWKYLNAKDINGAVAFLNENLKVTALDFSSQVIDHSLFLIICQIVRGVPHVNSLNLSRNRLGTLRNGDSDAIGELKTLYQERPELFLDLSHNFFNDINLMNIFGKAAAEEGDSEEVKVLARKKVNADISHNCVSAITEQGSFQVDDLSVWQNNRGCISNNTTEALPSIFHKMHNITFNQWCVHLFRVDRASLMIIEGVDFLGQRFAIKANFRTSHDKCGSFLSMFTSREIGFVEMESFHLYEFLGNDKLHNNYYIGPESFPIAGKNGICLLSNIRIEAQKFAANSFFPYHYFGKSTAHLFKRRSKEDLEISQGRNCLDWCLDHLKRVGVNVREIEQRNSVSSNPKSAIPEEACNNIPIRPIFSRQ